MGIFEKIFEKLSSDSNFSELSSTYVKAHKAAAGAKKGFYCRVSRGGKTSKIHTAVDEHGRPLKIILTAGNVNDCDVAFTLLENFNLQGKTIIADRGYSAFDIKNKLVSRFLSFVYLASIFSWL